MGRLKNIKISKVGRYAREGFVLIDGPMTAYYNIQRCLQYSAPGHTMYIIQDRYKVVNILQPGIYIYLSGIDTQVNG